MGLNFTIQKTLYFVDESNIWTMQHQWRAARLYQGASPISKSVQKVVWKTLLIYYFVKSRFLLGCDRLRPFFVPNNSQNPPPRTPPGRTLFIFFWRWHFTRYSEIVTFPIWGSSGRRVGRARAGAFSGTLARPCFAKPWGDFDGNPGRLLTIQFWSLSGNRRFLR